MTMTFYDLKRNIETHGNPYYFSEDTLTFFGETLTGFRLLKETEFITDTHGDIYECYVLISRRNKDHTGRVAPYNYYHYFSTDNYERVYP